jgi:hypothetical protein
MQMYDDDPMTRLERLENHVSRQSAQTIYDQLDAKIGKGWRQINTSPGFLSWLSNSHPYSGAVMRKLLEQAFASSDVSRVVRFFADYLASGGAAPGQQAPGQQQQDSNNIITSRDVTQFYRNCQRPGFYSDVERANIEGKIHAAAAAGQIRQVR